MKSTVILRYNTFPDSDFGFRISDFRALRGFTLIELLISIALALVLMLGVNAIFKYTTNAVGQGQAINAATRDSRAAQNVFSSDFEAMVSNGSSANDAPFLIIRSSAIPAFRDRPDELGDRDGNKLTIDLDGKDSDGDSNIEGDTTVPGEIISPATYNYRNHRIDVISFFARDLFPRQTGDPGTYVDPMHSEEAWIWYGHLWLPDNGGNYGATTFPGSGTSSSTNPNNYYGSQFALGRVAMLLTIPPMTDANGVTQQGFIQNTNPTDLTPLAVGSVSPTVSDTPAQSYTLQQSRFDLAATSIKTFKTKLTVFIAANPNITWWDAMMDGSTANSRFQCNPFPAKPLTSASLAQASPYFLPGCSQFIVEFAGDFVKQDDNPNSATYGQVLDFVTTTNGNADGLDYELVPSNAVARSKWQRKTRWYGLPRNTSGATSTISGNTGASYSTKTLSAGSLSDTLAGATGYPPTDSTVLTEVVPLRDVIAASPNARNTLHNLLLTSTSINPWIERNVPSAVADYTSATGGMPSGAAYTVAWGPDSDALGIPVPKLIRITINITDTSGRLPDGLTYQYVFKVPDPSP